MLLRAQELEDIALIVAIVRAHQAEDPGFGGGADRAAVRKEIERLALSLMEANNADVG